MTGLLDIAGLHVAYGRIAVLRGVDLTIGEGECVAVVGPNGAGKTTLLRAIAGAIRPAAGTIHFRSADLVGLPPERIVRSGVALVPEGRRILGTLTVRENLLLGMSRLPANRGLRREVLAEVGSLFPALEELLDRPAGQLSGGQQQQLAIARALASRPDVVLLDEPSVGLSPVLVDRLFETVASLRARGMTLLLVEQMVERAVEAADRTYVLHRGRAHAVSEDALRDREALRAYYLGGREEERV